jgi:hypothetical protein
VELGAVLGSSSGGDLDSMDRGAASSRSGRGDRQRTFGVCTALVSGRIGGREDVRRGGLGRAGQVIGWVLLKEGGRGVRVLVVLAGDGNEGVGGRSGSSGHD